MLLHTEEVLLCFECIVLLVVFLFLVVFVACAMVAMVVITFSSSSETFHIFYEHFFNVLLSSRARYVIRTEAGFVFKRDTQREIDILYKDIAVCKFNPV